LAPTGRPAKSTASIVDKLALSDRIAVIFGGRLVHETETAAADIKVIGPSMAGHHVHA
jgi:ABC-type uncharacterized transport system ATPase subunit